jgi:Leucine-rich repeat (LRR) protein
MSAIHVLLPSEADSLAVIAATNMHVSRLHITNFSAQVPDTIGLISTIRYLLVEGHGTLPDCLDKLGLEHLAYTPTVHYYQVPSSLAASTTLHTLEIDSCMIPSWLPELASLRTLVIARDVGRTAAAVIRNSKQVTKLVLKHMTEILSDVFEPENRNLHTLAIMYFKGTELPHNALAASLRKLHIACSQSLTRLPPSVVNLRELEELEVRDCAMIKCFPELGKLDNLHTLTLFQTFLPTTFPPNLVSLHVPSMLSGCLDVTNSMSLLALKLHCTQQTLREWTVEDDGFMPIFMPGLLKLTLRTCALEQFCNIHLFPALTELCIDNTICTELPAAIVSLTALRRLKMTRTGISVIPECISNMPALEVLCLSGMITQLPRCLHRIKSFTLRSCHVVQTLPDIFSESLCELDLTDSWMDLPAWMADSTTTRWTRLSLPRDVSALPPILVQQSRLVNLSCQRCRLKALPDGPACLPSLTEIDMTESRSISMLPSWIAELSALHTLKLMHCSGLTSLPETIGYLPNLTTLEMHFSHITSLPASLARRRHSLHLNLTNMPYLRHIPVTLAEMSIAPHRDHTRVASLYRLRHVLLMVLAQRRRGPQLPQEILIFVTQQFLPQEYDRI